MQNITYSTASGTSATGTLTSNDITAAITVSNSQNFQTSALGPDVLAVDESNDSAIHNITLSSDTPLMNVEIWLESILHKNNEESNYFGNFTFTLNDGTIITNSEFTIETPPAASGWSMTGYELATNSTDAGGINYAGDPRTNGSDAPQGAGYLTFPNIPLSVIQDGGGITDINFDFSVNSKAGRGDDKTAYFGVRASLNVPCNEDIDGDGIVNSQDLDSDGDGCYDVIESGGTDANNDGKLDGTDHDIRGLVTGGTDGYDGANGSETVAVGNIIITTVPDDLTVVEGSSATFSVVATADEATSYAGGSPVYGTPDNANAGLTYQWYLGAATPGNELSNNAIYSGVTTNTLNISNVTGLLNEEYFVVVSHTNNPCINLVESATLTVDSICNATNGGTDTDGDGVADICDLDDDNDGITDIEEGICTPITTSPQSTVTLSNSTTLGTATFALPNTPTTGFHQTVTINSGVDYLGFTTTSPGETSIQETTSPLIGTLAEMTVIVNEVGTEILGSSSFSLSTTSFDDGLYLEVNDVAVVSFDQSNWDNTIPGVISDVNTLFGNSTNGSGNTSYTCP